MKGGARRLAAELLIVVFGVLIALSVDAARQGLGQRRLEREVLQALREEFEANRRLLEEQLAVYRRRTDAAQALLSLGSGVSALPSDSLGVLWARVTRAGTYDPSEGVLAAAISTGNIGLVRDLPLRAALAQWPSDLQDLRYAEELVADLIYGHLVPWARMQGDFPNGGFGNGAGPMNSQAWANAFADRTMRNLLREEIAWGRIIEGARITETIDSIVTHIDAQIESQ
jgi:hypothetical protein